MPIRLVVAVCRRKETVMGLTRAGSYAARPLGAAQTLTTAETAVAPAMRPSAVVAVSGLSRAAPEPEPHLFSASALSPS